MWKTIMNDNVGALMVSLTEAGRSEGKLGEKEQAGKESKKNLQGNLAGKKMEMGK